MIAAFASAIGSADPVHTSSEAARAAGYRDVIAPPTFAVTLAQRCDRQLIEDPEAGIDYSRVVHGEQRFVHHRPITAGDEVLGTLTVDCVRAGRRPLDGDHPHRARHRRRRGAVHLDLDHRHPGRGVSMAVRTVAETTVGDTIGPVTMPVAPRDARRLRQRLRRPEPHPPGRGVRQVGRPARRHRPRHVDDGRRRRRSSRSGPATAGGSSSSAPGSPSRSWSRRAAGEIEVSGVVKAVDEAARRATVEVTATCGGEKVLGRCVAVVQLD